MARNVWKEIGSLTDRVSQHDQDIRELFEMSVADRETVKLQEESLSLLRRLGENHTRRISHVEEVVAHLRRRMKIRRK